MNPLTGPRQSVVPNGDTLFLNELTSTTHPTWPHRSAGAEQHQGIFASADRQDHERQCF